MRKLRCWILLLFLGVGVISPSRVFAQDAVRVKQTAAQSNMITVSETVNDTGLEVKVSYLPWIHPGGDGLIMMNIRNTSIYEMGYTGFLHVPQAYLRSAASYTATGGNVTVNGSYKNGLTWEVEFIQPGDQHILIMKAPAKTSIGTFNDFYWWRIQSFDIQKAPLEVRESVQLANNFLPIILTSDLAVASSPISATTAVTYTERELDVDIFYIDEVAPNGAGFISVEVENVSARTVPYYFSIMMPHTFLRQGMIYNGTGGTYTPSDFGGKVNEVTWNIDLAPGETAAFYSYGLIVPDLSGVIVAGFYKVNMTGSQSMMSWNLKVTSNTNFVYLPLLQKATDVTTN
jgi:hypothetical protein